MSDPTCDGGSLARARLGSSKPVPQISLLGVSRREIRNLGESRERSRVNGGSVQKENPCILGELDRFSSSGDPLRMLGQQRLGAGRAATKLSQGNLFWPWERLSTVDKPIGLRLADAQHPADLAVRVACCLEALGSSLFVL